MHDYGHLSVFRNSKIDHFFHHFTKGFLKVFSLTSVDSHMVTLSDFSDSFTINYQIHVSKMCFARIHHIYFHYFIYFLFFTKNYTSLKEKKKSKSI